MAAAYAALVSVQQIIDQLQNHPTPPISLPKQQIQSLTEIITSLQQFLEAYNYQLCYREEAYPLQMRIADAAHAIEDVIESHIVDQILADREQISPVDFYEAVQKVIDDMDHVKKEAMDVKLKMPRDYELPGADSSTSSSFDGPEQYRTMLGFDDILIQVLDKLTSQGSRRHVISITGMGGMGKTTLAKNVYQHELVVEHFDFLAWVKVSQQYKIRKLLLKLLEGEEQNLSQVGEYELGLILHKKLTGRRYLIIIDDIWDIQVWDRLRVFLPDNNNGSRIMITTRLSNLACQIDDSHIMEVDILDEENSWKLFCKHVFGEEDCPLELQGIGKQINVEGCKGLPLSLSVVGGLLAKSKRTKQYWEHIAENLNSTVNLEGDKHCLQLLYTSYNNLPIHLKPCFLFMGVYLPSLENFTPITFVVEFFIAEGFVKPISGKSLEEVAKEYVIELVERNLILIDKTDKLWDWMYKGCMIHDLLSDLCLRESQKQKFVHVLGERSVDNIPYSIDSIRRVFVPKNTPEAEVLHNFESASHLRSLCWDYNEETSFVSISSRLLRVVVVYNLEDVVEKVNLRLIMMEHPDQYRSLTSMCRFWNLQMFCCTADESSHAVTTPYDIWMMSLLGCIWAMTPICLLDPPCSVETDCSIILENLHTLLHICNFKCNEEVVKRIPHIRFLKINYTEVEGCYVTNYCLNNLGRLQRLQHLNIQVHMQNQTVQNMNHDITFPHSLLVLNLSGTTLHWDDVTTKIGSLPLLQVLALRRDSCIGAKWETIEGHFCSLTFLKIQECGDLEYWMMENTHFPRLQHLHLEGLHKLTEIPSSIGDISTLQAIYVEDCCDSVYCSAQIIEEEQEELGNEDLQVTIVGKE